MATPTHIRNIRTRPDNFISEYNDVYFSGAHAKIYFGHIWVDDIITFQWDVVNNKAPVYGYASELFDAVVPGTVIINGSFTIAFRDIGYLNTILNEMRRRDPELKGSLALGNQATLSTTLQNLAELPDKTVNKQIPTAEDMLNKALRGGQAQFNAIATQLENVIYNRNRKGGPSRVVRPDEYDRVGDIAKNKRIGKGFDILMEYGDPLIPGDLRTARTITDAHITGWGSIISPTGEPIAERYTFFARNIDENIPTRVKKPEEPPVSNAEALNKEIEETLEELVVRDSDRPVADPVLPDATDIDENIPVPENQTPPPPRSGFTVSPLINIQLVSRDKYIVTLSSKENWKFEQEELYAKLNVPSTGTSVTIGDPQLQLLFSPTRLIFTITNAVQAEYDALSVLTVNGKSTDRFGNSATFGLSIPLTSQRPTIPRARFDDYPLP